MSARRLRAPMRRSPATMGLLPGHPNGTPTAPSVTAASTRIAVTSPERAALFLPVGCQASIEGPAGTVRSRPGGPFCLLTVHLPLRQLGGLCALNARGPKGKIHHFRGLLSTSGDESRGGRGSSGRPARAILNRFIAEQGPLNAEAPAFPLATQAAIPLRTNADKQGVRRFFVWSGKARALGPT